MRRGPFSLLPVRQLRTFAGEAASTVRSHAGGRWRQADVDLKELSDRSLPRHPWEVARGRFFVGALHRSGVLASCRRVLDAGAGDGYVAQLLQEKLPVDASIVCFDAHYTHAFLEGVTRGPAGTGGRLTFVREEPDERFDLLLLLDVIEHVPDDRAFVAGMIERRLAPGGAVLVSVPTWPSLYTRHDVALGHFRRYRRAELRRVLEAAGLHLIGEGNLFHSLLPVRALEKLAEVARRVRSRPQGPGFAEAYEGMGVGGWNRGALLTGMLVRWLEADNELVPKLPWRLPGLSAWALCLRP
jgi:2-polyprenyl-3-methyl-5-hydroxy-6-metoxy-1,4-benzoquinol methylase